MEWKDVVFDAEHTLGVRLYKLWGWQRLLVFFYYRGDNLYIGSRTWPDYLNYCLHLAVAIVSTDHRLMPEHPLLATIKDDATTLLWLAS